MAERDRAAALAANVAETPTSPELSVEGEPGSYDDESDGEADRGIREGDEASVQLARTLHRCAAISAGFDDDGSTSGDDDATAERLANALACDAPAATPARYAARWLR